MLKESLITDGSVFEILFVSIMCILSCMFNAIVISSMNSELLNYTMTDGGRGLRKTRKF